jgi:hypothetical protein
MITRLSWRLIVLVGALAAGAGGTAAQATTCSDLRLPPGTYDSLTVPDGATCTITTGSVIVTGNVTVGTGASLMVTSLTNFTVFGSLSSVNASNIVINPAPGAANIFGGVSITGTTGTTSELRITDAFIGGTLSFADSNPHSIVLASSIVGGGVLVTNNQRVFVIGNTIGGSLVCVGNTPLPGDAGSANTVGGAKVGQCSSL